MTDRELEARLGAFYRAEVGEGETAPLALRRDVAAIPRTIPRATRWFGRSRGLTLLAAAALLLVGGAVAAGSGLVRLPSVVPPVPAPSLAVVATASPAAESPSPTIPPSPSPAETSSVVPARPPSWTPTGDLVAARWGGTAVLLQDGKVLVFGGSGAGPNAELYDPASGTWTATAHTPNAGRTATLLLDGKVLVVGAGVTAELYDPTTGSWTATGKLHTAHYGTTATLLPDGRVLVAGGVSTGDGVFTPVASAELYDPTIGSWTRTGSMGSKRAGATATLLPDGRVLVAGGSIPTGNGAGERVASAELYDPGTGKWTPTGDMTHVTGGSGATLLGDGKVLVVGVELRATSAQLYDPATGSWTATAPPSTLMEGFSVTALRDGRVLLAGGVPHPEPCDTASASAQLYDPRTGAWTATSDMIQARYGHSAILLPDGNVLVAGGATAWFGEPCRPGGDMLSSAELYDPGSGQ